MTIKEYAKQHGVSAQAVYQRIKKENMARIQEKYPVAAGSKGDFVTLYCYTEEERVEAIELLSPEPEITRFKGLGEISSGEFKDFIGKGMRLDHVKLSDEESLAEIMEFYMGDNTIERQNFICGNLRSEEELEDIDI